MPDRCGVDGTGAVPYAHVTCKDSQTGGPAVSAGYKIDARLAEERKALETVVVAIRDSGLAKTAREKSAKYRTLDERFAVLAETPSLCCTEPLTKIR